MLSKFVIKSLVLAWLISFQISCQSNHTPVIEDLYCEFDSVKPGQSVNLEVTVTDADNDLTKCYWFFNGKRDPNFDHKTKITWVSPNTLGDITIKVVVDDGKSETFCTKKIVVY